MSKYKTDNNDKKNSTKADCAQKFITWHYMTKNENIRKYEVVGIVEILLTFTNSMYF